jgi:hypothetical protein
MLENKRITKARISDLSSDDIEIMKGELVIKGGFIHGKKRAEWSPGGETRLSFDDYESFLLFKNRDTFKYSMEGEWEWGYIRKAWYLDHQEFCKGCSNLIKCGLLREHKPCLDIKDDINECYNWNKTRGVNK